ncbi:MAG: GntR family transcriptional regulator, partial [Chitinophagaceae bacterium]
MISSVYIYGISCQMKFPGWTHLTPNIFGSEHLVRYKPNLIKTTCIYKTMKPNMLKKEFPIYKKVFDDLKFSIESGKYPKGALLPSENELCKTYNTTRVTVRQALSGLMTIGYITRHHGKGSIVTEPKNGLGILSISGVTAGVGNQSLTTQILQKPVKQAWPHDFFYELTDEERSQGCLFFTRLRHIDGLPVLYEETYINDINLPRFSGMDFLRSEQGHPLTILTTAYSEFALESYQFNVVDYLL